MPVQSTSTGTKLRRRRRFLGALPLVLASWVALSGLPIQSAPGGPGTLHTSEHLLTAAPGTARAGSSKPESVSPGWTTGVDVAAGTQAVGVSWTGAPRGEVEIRGLTADGWTNWMHVHGNPDDGPDEAGEIAGDLVWFGGSGIETVELEVETGTLRNLKVEAMRYEQAERTAFQTALVPAAGAADTKPSILPRSEWTSKSWAYTNEDCENGPIHAAGGVKFAVVHHTVNSNTYSQSEVPGMLSAIYQFHTGTRGWCDIAYNFVIDRFGRTWEARTDSLKAAVVGGHAAGFNTNSVGVSFLGQHQEGESSFTAVNPTGAQLTAAGKVIGWKLGTSGAPATGTLSITPTTGGTTKTISRVSGHRDVGSTSCPGNLLYSQLSTIRSTAGPIAEQTTPTVPPPTTTSTTAPAGPSKPLGPFETPQELVDQSYRDLLRRAPNVNELNLASAAVVGGQKAEVFLANLINGNEANQNIRQPIRLYSAYFLRNPDHAGLDYWIQKRRAGWSIDRISTEFAAAPEFKKRYGSLNDGQFVDLVYRNVLDRSPDQKGRAHWVSQLSNGYGRGKMMIGFSESPEYVANTAGSVSVIALYDGMVNASVPVGTYDYLVPRLAQGKTDDSGVARFFMDKPEYHARFR